VTEHVLDTKTRLIRAMQRALQTNGYSASGLNELLAQAQVPKGVLYHHFPGGKSALAEAAIESLVEKISLKLKTLLASEKSPQMAFAKFLKLAAIHLEKGHFATGCPLATITLETAHLDSRLQAALHRGFLSLRTHLAVALEASGDSARNARAKAALYVSAYEGALLLARADRNVDVLNDALYALTKMKGRPYGFD
jgi:TetR/AcrR family transcriptional regulator, lmrAB and yxaGH operons repressor